MRFEVNPGIFKDFPELTLGVVIARNIDNSELHPDTSELLRQSEAAFCKKLGLERINTEPKITCWQKAYKKFGASPKKHLSSIESLSRSVLQQQKIRSINKIVDIYNAISLKYLLPAGGDDLDKITGNIRLGYATEQKPFMPLNGKETCVPDKREVVYSDDINTLCRRWNWRESDITKFTYQTKNALLVLEGLTPESSSDIQQAMQELQALIREYCGGQSQASTINISSTFLDLEIF